MNNYIDKLRLNQINKLNLSYDLINTEEAIKIANCLYTNVSLQKLDLSHNNIGSGIVEIIKSLCVNASVQTLNLSDNNISTDESYRNI